MSAGSHDDATCHVTPHVDLTLYTDADARAIWARAAQLQAEADAHVRRGYGVPPADDAPAAPHALLAAAPAGMFLASEVRAAAREAGIEAEHVTVAMAEHAAAGREVALVPSDADMHRFARELGTSAGSVSAVALCAADRDTVVSRLRAAFARRAYRCEFDGSVVGDAQRGEVLRFTLPGHGSDGWWESTRESGFAYHANRIGVAVLHVHVAPRGTAEQPGCEVRIVADLRPGAYFNAWFMRWCRPAMPPLTALAGWLLGGAAAEFALTSPPAVIGAAIGAALGGLMVPGLRRIMHWEQRTAMRVLEQSLDRILAATARGADGDISTVSPRPIVRPLRPADDSPGATLAHAAPALG